MRQEGPWASHGAAIGGASASSATLSDRAAYEPQGSPAPQARSSLTFPPLEPTLYLHGQARAPRRRASGCEELRDSWRRGA